MLRSQRELTDALYRIFTKSARDVADSLLHQLKQAQKAAVTIGTEVYDIDLSDFDDIAKEAQQELRSVMADSGKQSLLQLGITDQNLFGIVNEASAEYAKYRAAEMVGKKWVGGALVDNPAAEWVITDTTRDAIRALIEDVVDGTIKMTDLRQAIVNAAAFSKERAEMISRTELMTANAEGALKSFFEAEKAGLKIKKGWNSDTEACPICVRNTDAGAIALRALFPSGDLAPPAHPNCECVLVSEVEDDELGD